MTVQDIAIAFGGASASVAGYFLRECYLMLKQNRSDIADVKEDHIRLESRVKVVEEKLKIFHS